MEAAIRTQELNPGKLPALFRRQFELCKLARGQTVAIVSDLGTRREYIQAAFAAAEEMGVDIYEMCVNAIPGWTKVGVPTMAPATLGSRARSRRWAREPTPPEASTGSRISGMSG